MGGDCELLVGGLCRTLRYATLYELIRVSRQVTLTRWWRGSSAWPATSPGLLSRPGPLQAAAGNSMGSSTAGRSARLNGENASF